MNKALIYDQFAAQVSSAKEAGIYDKFFIAFGTLLGYVRERDIIGHDSDMDIGIMTDGVTAEQLKVYREALKRRGCNKYRWCETENPANNMMFWCSIRKHPKETGMKCCNWVFFEHKGYMWHHKGKDSLVKGIPSRYLELGSYVEFLGQKVRIPKYTGACLDFWYPDWSTPRKGGSSYGIIMKVKHWKDKSTWKIQNKI